VGTHFNFQWRGKTKRKESCVVQLFGKLSKLLKSVNNFVLCGLLTNGEKEDLIIQVVMDSPVAKPKTQQQEQQCKNKEEQ